MKWGIVRLCSSKNTQVTGKNVFYSVQIILDHPLSANDITANDSISRPGSLHLEINLTLEIGQVLLSLLHAWGLDKDLDRVAITKLGLLKPKSPVSYGVLSKGGVMSLMLPTWRNRHPRG